MNNKQIHPPKKYKSLNNTPRYNKRILKNRPKTSFDFSYKSYNDIDDSEFNNEYNTTIISPKVLN